MQEREDDDDPYMDKPVNIVVEDKKTNSSYNSLLQNKKRNADLPRSQFATEEEFSELRSKQGRTITTNSLYPSSKTASKKNLSRSSRRSKNKKTHSEIKDEEIQKYLAENKNPPVPRFIHPDPKPVNEDTLIPKA